MTREEWIERQLANAPERSDEWVAAMLHRFGLNPTMPSTATDPAVPSIAQDCVGGTATDGALSQVGEDLPRVTGQTFA